MSKDTGGEGGGVKAVWTMSQVKLLFCHGGFPYRSMQIDEWALQLLPDRKVQEVWLMVDCEEQEQEQEQEITEHCMLEENNTKNNKNYSGGIILELNKAIDKDHENTKSEPYKDIKPAFGLEDSSDEEEDSAASSSVLSGLCTYC